MTGVTTPSAAASVATLRADPPPLAVPPLRHSFSWTFAGYAAQAACQWGMLVVLAKLGSKQIVGQYAWGLAVTAPVMLLANLQLREVQATDAREQFRFGHYLALRLAAIAAALLAVVGIVAAVSPSRQAAIVALLVAGSKAFDGVADVLFGRLQRLERMKPIATTLIVNGAVSLAAMAILMALTRSVVWAAAGSLLGSAAALAAVARATARVSDEPMRPRWDGAALRQLAWLALPLGVVALLHSLNANVPRYFVEHHFGEGTLGVYAAMVYVVTAGTTVTMALAQSAAPRLAQRFAGGDFAAFRRLLLKMVATGAALGLAGVAVAAVAGRQLLALVYRPEYADAAPVFVWLMAGGAVGYAASFLNTAMVAARAVRANAVLIAIVASVCAAASAALIPRYGLTGAAWAVGLTYVVQFIGASAILLAVAGRPRQHPAQVSERS